MAFDLFKVDGFGSGKAATLYVFAKDAEQAAQIAHYGMHVHRVELVAIAGYCEVTPRWTLPLNFSIEEEGVNPNPWRSVGEDEVAAVFDSMPDGHKGFLTKWGYLTFARSIEAKARELNDPNFDPSF